MRNNELSLKAGGTLGVCTFVKIDTTGDDQVVAAGAGDTAIGITPEWQDRTPGLPGSDTTISALVGEYIALKAMGDDCLLLLGTGGCTRGDFLKSDAAGAGVTASSTNVVGAIALQSGLAGNKVRVMVLPVGSKMP